MSAAKINGTTVTQLDGKAGPDEAVTELDVQDAAKLSKMLARVLSTLAGIRRRHDPTRVDFEDVAVSTAGASVTFQHNFGGRVRWWVTDWACATNVAPILRKDDTNTTATALVLLSYVAGTVTIRVESVG